MADDIYLRLHYADGELRESAAVHWSTAGLPRKPIAHLVARQRGRDYTINAAAEYAVLVGEPLRIFCLSPSRAGQVAGVVWKFFAGGRDPEVANLDERIGSAALPPASAFIPGTLFGQPVRASWWRRLLALDARLR